VASRRIKRVCPMCALSIGHQQLLALQQTESSTKEEKGCSSDRGRQAVAAFLHDEEHHGHGQRPQHRRHSTKCDIRNPVGDVGISDVVELEVTIVTNEPAHEGEQELAERRVDIEEVRSFQILRSIGQRGAPCDSTEQETYV